MHILASILCRFCAEIETCNLYCAYFSAVCLYLFKNQLGIVTRRKFLNSTIDWLNYGDFFHEIFGNLFERLMEPHLFADLSDFFYGFSYGFSYEFTIRIAFELSDNFICTE